MTRFAFLVRRWLVLAGLGGLVTAPAGAAGCPDLLNHTLGKLQDGSAQSLCQFEGQVILAVNTASYCGFTSQYEGLEALYKEYKDEGFVVLGFPSNDFKQEKTSNQEIADFCFNTYGVAFPMFESSSVKGDDANPFFKALQAAGAGAPRWNFYKYLIGRDGQVIDSYSSLTTPSSLRKHIEKALQAK